MVGGAIFCCHGGLGPKLVKLSQIKKLKKPKTIPYEGLMCDLLWADPETQNAGDHRWKNNEERGVSYVFGEWAVRQFLEVSDYFSLVIYCIRNRTNTSKALLYINYTYRIFGLLRKFIFIQSY